MDHRPIEIGWRDEEINSAELAKWHKITSAGVGSRLTALPD